MQNAVLGFQSQGDSLSATYKLAFLRVWFALFVYVNVRWAGVYMTLWIFIKARQMSESGRNDMCWAVSNEGKPEGGR